MNSDRREPNTVVLMSADIVGATAFKESMHGREETLAWPAAFETFFRELPLVLMGQVALAFSEADSVPELGVWKVFGDEMVFRASPRSAEEALLLTESFYRSLIDYDSRVSGRWPLRLRGCCWAARFPERNIEIEIPEMAGAGHAGDAAYVDYLGPDVDTGFRLIERVGGGHVIVSLNLAEALAHLTDDDGLRFHHVGEEVLKGVYRGRPYPMLLISLADRMPEPPGGGEESLQYAFQYALRDDSLIAPDALIELGRRTREDLKRTRGLDLAPIEF